MVVLMMMMPVALLCRRLIRNPCITPPRSEQTAHTSNVFPITPQQLRRFLHMVVRSQRNETSRIHRPRVREHHNRVIRPASSQLDGIAGRLSCKAASLPS